MGSARLVFGFGGHGQLRQRREGGGEQRPQLKGTVGSFDRFTFVIINKFSLNVMLVLIWRVGDGLSGSRFSFEGHGQRHQRREGGVLTDLILSKSIQLREY